MAQVTASMVKELRDRTGAGMMEAKKALVAADGSIEDAIKALRQSGAVKAEKKADRATNEGRVSAVVQGGAAALIAVLCETDFVAKNAQFQEFSQDVAESVVAASSVDDPNEIPFKSGGTVGDAIKQQVLTIGENLKLGRVVRMAGDGVFFGVYVHHNGKLGVVTMLRGEATETGLNTAKEIAMHAAFTNPVALDKSGIPADMIQREREIFRTQVEKEGKPANMIDKIVDGKIAAFVRERALVEQAWVNDSKKTIRDLAKEAGAELVDFAYIGV
jgi:elongation factor Ts